MFVDTGICLLLSEDGEIVLGFVSDGGVTLSFIDAGDVILRIFNEDGVFRLEIAFASTGDVR